MQEEDFVASRLQMGKAALGFFPWLAKDGASQLIPPYEYCYKAVSTPEIKGWKPSLLQIKMCSKVTFLLKLKGIDGKAVSITRGSSLKLRGCLRQTPLLVLHSLGGRCSRKSYYLEEQNKEQYKGGVLFVCLNFDAPEITFSQDIKHKELLYQHGIVWKV